MKIIIIIIIFIFSLVTLTLLVTTPLMGCTLCNCIFLGIIALPHPTRLLTSSFLMLRSLRSFVITPTKLRTPSGKNPRYYVIIYSSWPNILIHSPEVAKMSKAAPSDFFSDANYVKLFVEFLSSNTSFKSDTTDPANHTIVSRC